MKHLTKYILACCLVSCYTAGKAQIKLSLQQKSDAAESIYSTLESYIQNVALSETGVNGISQSKATQFKGLFTDDAQVWDDLTPSKFPGAFENDEMQLVGSSKPVQQLLNDYTRHFPNGISVNIISSNIDLKQVDKGMASITIIRNISGLYDGSDFLSNQNSTLKLDFEVSPNFTSAKIRSIKNVGSSSLRCPNCKRSGSPVGLDVHFSASTLLNSGKVQTMQLSRLMYDSMLSDSIVGSGLKGLGFSSNIDLGLDVFFGKERHFGVGVGFHYGYHSFKYSIDEYKLRYRGENALGQPNADFLRLFTANNIEEKLELSNYGINIALKYVLLKKKAGFYASLGINANLQSKATSDFTVGSSDYEAIYQYRDGDYTFDPTGAIEQTDLIITQAALAQLGPESSIENYFEEMANFGVALNDKKSGKSDQVKFNRSAGFSFDLGTIIKLSERAKFSIGFQFGYVSIKDNTYAESLSEGDRPGDKLNSTLYGVDAIGIINYGLNFGLSYSLIK